MSNDSVVVVPTISTGVNIDNTAVTQPGSTAANRQRVDIPNVVRTANDVETNILIELRVISYLLAVENGIQEDLNNVRQDFLNQMETT